MLYVLCFIAVPGRTHQFGTFEPLTSFVGGIGEGGGYGDYIFKNLYQKCEN